MYIIKASKVELTYCIEKYRSKFVKHMIGKNCSIKEIYDEQKAVGLLKTGTTQKDIKKYIERTFRYEWDENDKKWKEIQQGSITSLSLEDVINKGIDDSLSSLSDNDIQTILKDTKLLLSNMGKVVIEIKKISEDIHELVAIISKRYS